MPRKILFLSLFFLTLPPGGIPARSEETKKDSHDSTFRALAANRSLLARFEAEYTRLKETADDDKKLSNLEIKLRALREDSSRLAATLPEDAQAHEFLKDVLRKTKAQKSQKTPILDALHQKALGCVAQNKMTEAAKIYEQITLLDPDDDQAYLLMGHSYLLSGQYRKAEEAFQNAVHIDPENGDEIAPFYENLSVRNPNDDSAYANLGYAYLIVGEPLKAKEAFRNALAANPDNAAALNGLRLLEA